jgi:hypothetical protein
MLKIIIFRSRVKLFFHMLVPDHVIPIWISFALGSLDKVASQAPLPPTLL